MLRKKILFWLVWLFLGPLVFLFYCITALKTGRWDSIALKTSMVFWSIWDRLVVAKSVIRNTVDRYGKKR